MRNILRSGRMVQLSFAFFIIGNTMLFGSSDSAGYRHVEVVFGISGFDEIINARQSGIYFETLLTERLQNGRANIRAIVENRDVERLKRFFPEVQIRIPDMELYYEQRSIKSQSLKESSRLKSDPASFTYGSIGGFYSPDEMAQKLDELQSNYPDLISVKTSLGKSIEDRDLWMVKVSDNPQLDEDEPEVLLDAMHHAREPEGMMTLFYFIEYLLENYGSDSLVTYLVDNREIYFVPLVNPDGYTYNCINNPDGGGLWRKNKRTIGSTLYGVDLNRNYGYKWGYDDFGSSPFPSADDYRGDHGFSEPETQAMRDFTSAHHFKTNLSLHTYSDLFLYPFGYDEVFPDDFQRYIQWADDITQYNYYQYGTCWELLYFTNGGSFDYNSAIEGIYSFSPEMGNGDDGFWPSVERILPIARINLQPLLYITQAADWYLEYTDVYQFTDKGIVNGYADPGDTIYIRFEVRNKGLGSIDSWNIALNSDDQYIQLLNNTTSSNPSVNAGEYSLSDSLSFIVKTSTPAGHYPNLTLQFSAHGTAKQFPIRNFIIGTPVTLFEDNGTQGMVNWSKTGEWDTLSDIASGVEDTFFTDNPYGDYYDDQTTRMSLIEPIMLHENAKVFLEYKTQYEIEAYYDAAMVQISFNGSIFQTLAGALSKPDSLDYYPDNKPQYFGVRQNWTKEIIEISDLLEAQGPGNHPLYLHFVLRTDWTTNRAGWSIDDIKVYEMNNLASVFSMPDTSHLCSGNDAILLVNPYSAYNWSTAATTQSIQVAEAGWYSVTVTDYLGEQATDSTYVVFFPEPMVDLGADFTLLTNADVQLDAGDFESYLWNTGDVTRYISIQPDTWEEDTAWFIVHVIDINGCEGADTLVITRAPVSISDPFQENLVKVYPNPFYTALTVEVHGERGYQNLLEVCSLSGQILFSQHFGSKYIADITFLPEGVYLIRVSNQFSTYLTKIVKLKPY